MDNHGKGKAAVIEGTVAAADIVVVLLQSGHDDPVAAHARNDFRHRMGEVGKGL